MTTEKNIKTKTKYLLNIAQTSVKCPKGNITALEDIVIGVWRISVRR